jgi:hypothetical protein
MRRLLLLPALAAAVYGFGEIDRAGARQGETFGVLKTAPASGLPAGIQPEHSRAPTAPANPYPLPAEAGPWLICAAHFVGFDGADLAKQVVEELRNKHHLKAWIFNRGDEERRKQEQDWEEYKKRFPPGTPLRPRRYRVQDDWAVLVGDFPDFKAASDFLPQIRGDKHGKGGLPVPDLKLADGKRCPVDVVSYEEMDPDTKKMVRKQGWVSPYHYAMAVRNPLAANNQKMSNWDPSWTNLNAYEDFSLLKNPKKFTLLVRKYSGGASIQSGSSETGWSKRILATVGLGSREGEGLANAGAQAHELARFLRDPNRFGFDAYVLHTRNSSIVTVGAFNSPDDPALVRVKQQLANLRFSTDSQHADPKNPDPIGLLANPVVVAVPRP